MAFAYTKLMQAMVAAGVVSATDPYFNLVTLLLPGNGTNGAQNNTFLDSSTNNFSITRNGNTTQGTFSPFSQTGWGNFFNGSNAYLSIGSNAVLAPGTGDFWVECWINLSNLPSSGTTYAVLQNDALGVSTNDKFWFGVTNNAGTYRLQVGRHGTSDASYVNWTPSIGVWYHIAYGRSSGTSYLFIDGVSQTVTGSLSGISFGQNGVVIGAVSTPYYFPGYISNLRYIVGAVLYTSTFTPSTTPLTTTSQGASSSQVEILTCQDNRFIDNSSNAFAITVNGTPSVQAFSPFAPTAAYSAATIGGSGYFDGTGDYLSVADNTAFDIGSGDFTFEAWVYTTAFDSQYNVIVSHWPNSGTQAWIMRITSTYIGFVANIGGTQIYDFATTVNLNEWMHICFTRSGTTLTAYKNGTQLGATQTITGTVSNGTGNITVGVLSDLNNTTDHTGYISGLRIIKGTATAPTITSPPTNVTNTSLLLNFTNAGITDATAKNDLETVGNAQVSTTQSKFGGSSMYFDGTGDYLTAPASPNNNLNIGDFTLEFWVYRANLTGDVDIVGCGNVSTTGYQVRIKGTTGYVQFLVIGGATITTTTGIAATTWTHIAIVRSGTTVKIYINGTDGGGSGTVGNSGTVTTELLVVGANRYDYSNTLNGYIDDLRITKGYARYTANFTAPTAAFPVQ